MGKLTIIERIFPILASPVVIVDPDPEFVGRAGKATLHPMAKTLPESVRKAYEQLLLFYRYGLESRKAELRDIRISEELGLFVALFCVPMPTSHPESFIWLYKDGRMHEVEQRNIQGVKVRELDRRAMDRSARWR